MNNERFTVPKNLSRGVNTVKFKIILFAGKVSLTYFFTVITGLTLVVVTAILTVSAVPGVR